LVTEEEQVERLPFAAYHRVRTLLYLSANANTGGTRVVEIDPAELAAAVVSGALRTFDARPAPPE
jgi:hypothetical protein